MPGLNYLKLGSTLSNICNTTQLDDATKCHYAFKNFWGEPCNTQSSVEDVPLRDRHKKNYRWPKRNMSEEPPGTLKIQKMCHVV